MKLQIKYSFWLGGFNLHLPFWIVQIPFFQTNVPFYWNWKALLENNLIQFFYFRYEILDYESKRLQIKLPLLLHYFHAPDAALWRCEPKICKITIFTFNKKS